jgi:hypothetical protein
VGVGIYGLDSIAQSVLRKVSILGRHLPHRRGALVRDDGAGELPTLSRRGIFAVRLVVAVGLGFHLVETSFSATTRAVVFQIII